jgi:hypothetical protein
MTAAWWLKTTWTVFLIQRVLFAGPSLLGFWRRCLPSR